MPSLWSCEDQPKGCLWTSQRVVWCRISTQPVEATALPLARLQGCKFLPYCSVLGQHHGQHRKDTPMLVQIASGNGSETVLYKRWYRCHDFIPLGSGLYTQVQYRFLWAAFSPTLTESQTHLLWLLTPFIIGTLISKAYIKYSCLLTHGTTVSLHVWWNILICKWKN